MSDIKWIKVAADMFEDSKIEFIRSLPEGDAIIVTWIQMLSIAGQSNAGGYLMVTDGIPYTEQLLSNKLRRQPVLLQFALETLQKLKMINVEDGPYHITKWEKHQNVDGMEKVRLKTAQRVAKHRLKNKENIECNVTVALPVTADVTHGNAIELELEKEKEKEYIHAFDDFTRISKVYAAIHGVLEMPYSNSPLLTALLNDGIPADHIIAIIREKHRPNVKTLKFYEGAIRDSWETGKAGSLRSRGQSQAAARMDNLPTVEEFKAMEEQKKRERQAALRREMFGDDAV